MTYFVHDLVTRHAKMVAVLCALLVAVISAAAILLITPRQTTYTTTIIPESGYDATWLPLLRKPDMLSRYVGEKNIDPGVVADQLLTEPLNVVGIRDNIEKLSIALQRSVSDNPSRGSRAATITVTHLDPDTARSFLVPYIGWLDTIHSQTWFEVYDTAKNEIVIVDKQQASDLILQPNNSLAAAWLSRKVASTLGSGGIQSVPVTTAKNPWPLWLTVLVPLVAGLVAGLGAWLVIRISLFIAEANDPMPVGETNEPVKSRKLLEAAQALEEAAKPRMAS